MTPQPAFNNGFVEELEVETLQKLRNFISKACHSDQPYKQEHITFAVPGYNYDDPDIMLNALITTRSGELWVKIEFMDETDHWAVHAGGKIYHISISAIDTELEIRQS